MGEQEHQDTTATTNESSNILIPVEQDTVSFYGRELVAVRLPDGRIAAVLRWMCEGLGLGVQSQLRHIRGRMVLSRGLVTVRVQTDGGPQPMPAVTLDVLPGWLFTIDERRVKPDLQADVIRYQSECAQVLAEHFAHKDVRELPAPTTLVPSEPVERPVAPGEGAPLSAWREYHQRMLAFIDWQADIEQWRGTVESRLESVEELTRIVPELLNRLGPETLSSEHQASVKSGVKRLVEISGYHQSTIYADLNSHFHVPRYQALLEEDWPRITEWLRVRIEAAQKQQQQKKR